MTDALNWLFERFGWRDTLIIAFIVVGFWRENYYRKEIDDLNSYVRTTYERVLEENTRALIRIGEK